MAKKRIIDSRIRKSLSFAELTYRQRDLWHGLITIADDQGRTLAMAPVVRSEVWPYDDIGIQEVEDDLQALVEKGMIHVYQVENKPILQLINWWKYQVKQWAGPSDWEPPLGWVDRLRYHGAGHKIILENWGEEGGFTGGNAYTNQVENQVKNQVVDDVGVNESDSDKDSKKEDQEVQATPASLEAWLELLKEEKNKPAVLRSMIEVIYPSLVEYPDYSYIGKTARQVGGAGRLAALIWEAAGKNVKGDLLAYVQAMTRNQKKQQTEPAGFDGLREYAQAQGWEGSNGD